MAIASTFLGTNSIIGVGVTGQTVPAGTFVTIGGVASGSLTITHDAVDTTNNDDAGYTSFQVGNATATLSLECRFDPVGDTAQATIRTAFNAKAVKAFKIEPAGAANGEDSWSFEGHVISMEINGGTNNETVNISMEIQSTGAITWAAGTT